MSEDNPSKAIIIPISSIQEIFSGGMVVQAIHLKGDEWHITLQCGETIPATMLAGASNGELWAIVRGWECARCGDCPVVIPSDE